MSEVVHPSDLHVFHSDRVWFEYLSVGPMPAKHLRPDFQHPLERGSGQALEAAVTKELQQLSIQIRELRTSLEARQI